MRKNCFFLLGILALSFPLIAKTVLVNAQYTPDGQDFPLASSINITTPSNTTYNYGLLTLNVTFNLLLDPNCTIISYSLDGNPNSTMPFIATLDPIEALRTYPNGTTTTVTSLLSPYNITGSVVLPELPDGSHNITVYTKIQSSNIIGLDHSTVYFTINTQEPSPSPTIEPSPTPTPDPEELGFKFPTAEVIISIVVISIALVSVYFLKKKSETKKE